MRKIIIIAIMMLSLIPILGCEEISRLTQGTTQEATSPNLKILEAVELGSEWEMKQITFDVGAGDEVAILLKLADGDEVDGYFYLEEGEEIDFSITGKTSLFESEVQDRFSFIASQDQGDTYTLAFRNTTDDPKKKASVVLEVIYPVGGSVYIPVAGE
jgi:hypothetical protein